MDAMALPDAIVGREEIDAVLSMAAAAGASDVYVSTYEPVMMRVHGRIQDLAPRRVRANELNRWVTVTYDENPAGISRVRAGTPIDYSYECRERLEGERLRWRVNAAGILKEGQTDVRVVMRRISSEPPTVEKLGTPENLVKASDHLARGLMIVTGPTGSGKSTTLSALLRRRVESEDDHVHLVTLESPVEYIYDDVPKRHAVVTQIEVGRHVESFERGVENALRQDPDLILVGETRDRETARAVLQAAQTGHGVYTTLHTNGVTKTLIRLLEVFPARERETARESLVDAVSVVMAQRLLPRVGGGRVAAFEYLIFDEDLKASLRGADNFSSVLEGALHERGMPMGRYVGELLKAGVIDEKSHDDFMARWSMESLVVQS